jgi:ABC-2 type transport system permease protein
VHDLGGPGPLRREPARSRRSASYAYSSFSDVVTRRILGGSATVLAAEASPALASTGPGEAPAGPRAGERAHGVVGCALYFTPALFAAGLTAPLRSGIAALGVLVPFVLIVSFVGGDLAAA